MSATLSEQDLEVIRSELATGQLPMVWFTSAAVGVEEGRSGKVLALGEETDGDFIQVRPTGSMDVLSFSPSEVTFLKPSRKRTATPTEEVSVSTGHAPVDNADQATAPAPAESTSTEKPAAKAKTGTKKTAAPAELTVTLTASPEGDWMVECVNGKRKIKPVAVSPANVATFAQELPAEIAEAVTVVLETARERHRQRVEQLQAELAAAQQALQELVGSSANS